MRTEKIAKEVRKEFGSEELGKLSLRAVVQVLVTKGLITQVEIEDAFVKEVSKLQGFVASEQIIQDLIYEYEYENEKT